MVSENTTRTSKSPAKTGFQSPLFLAIAICFSVMTVAAFIAVSISDFDLFAVLGFAFSLVSTIFAWIAFAKGHSKGSVKGLRLYMAYSNVINKIVLSFIYAIGGVLLVGCLILTLVGDIMTDTIIPALEQSVKPVLEQVIEYAGEFENMSLEEFDEFLAQSDLSREQLKTYGIELEGIEDIQALFGSLAIVSGVVLGFWDQAISFLSTRFYIITIMVAVAYAVAIVAYIFMGKAYKNTSKYLKVLASDPDTNKKAPFITLIIGGAFIAILGIAMLESNVFLGLAKLVESAVIIMLAVLFRQMKRSKPEPIAAAENIEEAPAAEATADEVITENTPAEESTFYEAPAENAPVSEISVDATIEE